MTASNNTLKWILTGTLHPPLISTEEILHGGVFMANTSSEDCFHLFKSVRGPLFSPPTCVNALQPHKKREAAVAAPLQANGGYLELEKRYASKPFPPHVIFYPCRRNDPEVLLYTWYVEVFLPGYLLSVINSVKCAGNILK